MTSSAIPTPSRTTLSILPDVDLGEVRVGPLRFPVTCLELAGRGVRICFGMHGPQPAGRGRIVVIGTDGWCCWQGRYWDLPELAEGESWHCQYTACQPAHALGSGGVLVTERRREPPAS